MLRRLLPLLLLVLLIGGTLMWWRGKADAVEAVRPTQQILAEALALSGRVHGRQESRLAPEVSGTLRQVLVSEGQSVPAGQLLAWLDQDRLKAQQVQAQERVRVAQAQLEIARRGPLPSELEQVRSEVESQRLGAQARLENARQRLLEAERGTRSEQIEAAQATYREALTEAEQRQREAARQDELAKQGAVSLQAAEQARTLAGRAREASESARARLEELRRGPRPEVIEQARQEVRAAEADVLAAQQAGAARLQQLRDLPRPEDVALAEAQLEEARQAARVAEEQLRQSEIHAPYDGIVGKLLLKVGDQAGPNAPVLSFSSNPALEIRVDVDEGDVPRLALGQQAEVRASGQGEAFQAKVAELSHEVDSLRGTLEVRLLPANPPPWLVPGQTVDVNLFLSEQKPWLVVPLTCIMLRPAGAEVMLVENGEARVRSVEVSGPTTKGYLIRSGLEGDELVLLYPQGVEEGQKLGVTEAP
jgi:RND family efflux transporter MFP subunit